VVDTSVATIATPKQGDQVQQCAIISGTAKLAPGKTLVSAMLNKDNGDPTRYYQPVTNWQVPTQLINWTAKQYFGSGDAAVGQHFAVEIYSTDLKTVRSGFSTEGKDWFTKDPPAGSTMVARVEVKRVAGKGPVDCQ
jgi:hypothetical protein